MKKCLFEYCNNTLTGRQTKFCCDEHKGQYYYARSLHYCKYCGNELKGNQSKFCCKDHYDKWMSIEGIKKRAASKEWIRNENIELLKKNSSISAIIQLQEMNLI